MLIEGDNILTGELDRIKKVLIKPLDAKVLTAYSEWLHSKGDERAGFVVRLTKVIQNKPLAKLGSSKGMNLEWLDVIGYTAVAKMKASKCFTHLENIKPLLRPALRLKKESTTDDELQIGG